MKESSGNLQQITELIHVLEGTPVRVFAGDDNIALAALAAGASGLISVASNEIPAEMQRMVHAALINKWDVARTLQRQYYPLLLANFWETSPAPVKHMLARMGRIAPVWRLPMVPLSSEVAARLDALTDALGLTRAAGASSPSSQ